MSETFNIRENMPVVVGIDTSTVAGIFENLASVIGEGRVGSLLYDYKRKFNLCHTCEQNFSATGSVELIPHWYYGYKNNCRGRKIRCFESLNSHWNIPKWSVCAACARRDMHEFVDALFMLHASVRCTAYKAMMPTLRRCVGGGVAYRFYVGLVQECFSRESEKYKKNIRAVTEMMTLLNLLT